MRSVGGSAAEVERPFGAITEVTAELLRKLDQTSSHGGSRSIERLRCAREQRYDVRAIIAACEQRCDDTAGDGGGLRGAAADDEFAVSVTGDDADAGSDEGEAGAGFKK